MVYNKLTRIYLNCISVESFEARTWPTAPLHESLTASHDSHQEDVPPLCAHLRPLDTFTVQTHASHTEPEEPGNSSPRSSPWPAASPPWPLIWSGPSGSCRPSPWSCPSGSCGPSPPPPATTWPRPWTPASSW